MLNLFSQSPYGALKTVPGGDGVLRIGTTTALSATVEQVSNLYTVSADSAATAFTSRLYVNSDTAQTVTQAGNRLEMTRKITLDTTDTGLVAGAAIKVSIDPALTKTYTNTSSNGVSVLFVTALTRITAGTLAITSYHGIFVFTDSTANTGRKTSIRLGILTGGTVGNASIADNIAYSGDYFINSTSANPSLLSGYLELKYATDPGAPTDAVRVATFPSTAGTPAHTLALRTEAPVEAGIGIASTNKMRVWVNAVEYYIPLTAV